jgi:hypothetical protein
MLENINSDSQFSQDNSWSQLKSFRFNLLRGW